MHSLATIPFFKDLPNVDFPAFDRRVTWRRYDDGEAIVDYEDLSTDVYFILAGDVRILIRTAAGKEFILSEMHVGEFFGELAAIDGIKRSANVTVLTRTEVCIVPAAVFKELLFASRVAAERTMRLLTGRVRELNARLAEHAIFDLKHRLYSELLRSSQPRSGHTGQRVITPPPFHHVIAGRIGCRREQVTRELSVLAAEEILQKTRGALVILRPAVLQLRLDEALREEA